MKLNETKIGRWLALVRIQSTPVTVLTLCLGYATVAESITHPDVVLLVIVGALGHWGYYAQNDVFDYSYDVQNKDNDKPLVSEAINIYNASVVSTLLILISVVLAVILLSMESAIWFILAITSGLIYNIRSKKDWYSGLYLSIWGACIVMSGASYAGQSNMITHLLAVGIAVHMLMMTIIGDVKDITADEPSIPRLLDVDVNRSLGNRKLSVSYAMILVWSVLHYIESLVLIGLSIGSHLNAITDILVFVAIMPVLAGKTVYGERIFEDQKFNEDRIKKKIVIYTVVTVVGYIVALLSSISLQDAAILFIGSILWGLMWQKIQYGKALYFP